MVQSPIMNPGDTHWCQTPVKNRYNQVLQDGKVRERKGKDLNKSPGISGSFRDKRGFLSENGQASAGGGCPPFRGPAGEAFGAERNSQRLKRWLRDCR